MHYAAESPNREIIDLLLDRGADINALNVDGNSAAHYTGAAGSAEIMHYLIERGCDPLVVNNRGYTCFDKLKQRETQKLAVNFGEADPANRTQQVNAVFPISPPAVVKTF